MSKKPGKISMVVNYQEAKDEIREKALPRILKVAIPEFKKFKSIGKLGEFMMICPFHNENTASFRYNPRKRRFKCYGCGKSFEVIEFLAELRKIEYFTAFVYLARILKIKLIWAREKKGSNFSREILDPIRIKVFDRDLDVLYLTAILNKTVTKTWYAECFEISKGDDSDIKKLENLGFKIEKVPHYYGGRKFWGYS